MATPYTHTAVRCARRSRRRRRHRTQSTTLLLLARFAVPFAVCFRGASVSFSLLAYRTCT